MKTVFVILIAIVLLLKYGWKLVKYMFKHTWTVVGFLLLGLYVTSDHFLDEKFKDNDWLRENGYEMGSEGVKEAFHDGSRIFWDNREEILNATKEALIEYSDSLTRDSL